MFSLLPTAQLTSLRSFAQPLQEQPVKLCRPCSRRRPIVAQAPGSLCRKSRLQSKRDVSAAARVVAENPTAPEVKAGQQACSTFSGELHTTRPCSSKHYQDGHVDLQVKWFAVVANAEFMLHDVQNEAFAEQLRERRRLLLERDTQVNFFIVSEPAWLDKHFPDKAKQVRRPCVALVSTDEQWIL